jgi:hypothetical protein
MTILAKAAAIVAAWCALIIFVPTLACVGEAVADWMGVKLDV